MNEKTYEELRKNEEIAELKESPVEDVNTSEEAESSEAEPAPEPEATCEPAEEPVAPVFEQPYVEGAASYTEPEAPYVAPVFEGPAEQLAAQKTKKKPAVQILAVCLAAVLGATAFLGVKCGSLGTKVSELEQANAQLTEEKETLESENAKLTKEVQQAAERLQDKIKENAALSGYKNVVAGFYLDNAVVVLENDQEHYHRFGCPEIPTSAGYSFWVFNSEAAIGYGCEACPTCHADSADEFCKKYIEN